MVRNVCKAMVKLISSGEVFEIDYDYNYTTGVEDKTFVMKRMILTDGRVFDIVWENIEWIQYMVGLNDYAEYCKIMYNEHHKPDVDDEMDSIDFDEYFETQTDDTRKDCGNMFM